MSCKQEYILYLIDLCYKSKWLFKLLSRLLKIYGKYSHIWTYEPPNYLGKQYLVHKDNISFWVFPAQECVP